MLEISPEITKQINRLNEINNDANLREETEKLNNSLLEQD
jgi:hypothetical protein